MKHNPRRYPVLGEWPTTSILSGTTRATIMCSDFGWIEFRYFEEFKLVRLLANFLRDESLVRVRLLIYGDNVRLRLQVER